MKPALLTTVLGASVGFLGMFALGHYLSPQDQADLEAQVTASNSSGPAHRQRTRPARDGALVTQQMNAIRSAGSPQERMRRTVALANSLPVSEFAAWTEGDRFNFREGPELDVFRMILFERWINESPETLIPVANKRNTGQANRALAFLANHQPQLLINFYRSNPNESEETSHLGEIAKKHPALTLQRLQELSASGLSSDGLENSEDLFQELAKNSPAVLESAFPNLPPQLQQAAESAMCAERLKTSFPKEIRALWARPDGWHFFERILSNHGELAKNLIGELASMPDSWKAGIAENYYDTVTEANAQEWIAADLGQAGFSPSQIRQIRNAALVAMASKNPESALENLAGAELDADSRERLIFNVMRTARGDEAKTQKLINMLTSEEDRQFASNQLKFAEISAGKEKSLEPKQWLEALGSLQDAHKNPYQLLHQMRSWDQTTVTEMRAQLQAMPDDQKLNIARTVAAGDLDLEIDSGFAGDAIRYFVSNPPELLPENRGTGDDPVMVSSKFAVKLSMTQPEAATAWINTLPEGEAKLWASKNLAANWRQYDPKAVDQWIKTLPAATREEVSTYLKDRR